MAPIFLLPLAVWAMVLPSGPDRAWALVWAGAFYGFQAASDMLRQILRARQDVGRELLARVAYPLGNLLALVVAWRLHPGPTGALMALASGPAALTIAYLVSFSPQARRVTIDRETWVLARTGLATILQSLAYLAVVGVASRVDAFLLESYAELSEVGRYFAALNMVMAGGFFAQGVASYLYPRMHRQRERRARAFFRSIGVQVSLAAALGLGAAFVGPVLFRTVFRAKSFVGADRLMPAMGGLLFLTALDWLWLSVLIGRDKIWISALNLLPSLAAKLVLAPIWVPSLGADGMVRAALVGQVITTALGGATAFRCYLGASSPPK
jgi:O-antigen/teichoic acid export membrane protein